MRRPIAQERRTADRASSVRARMFDVIVVGTDGSRHRARARSSRRCRLAAALGARLEIVSAYEPVPASRLRAEVQQAPPDVQWTIGPREDVEALLGGAARRAGRPASRRARTPARATPPTRSSTSPRRRDAGADRRRQQGHDRRQALPARQRAEQGQPPRALLGADHPHELATRSRRAARSLSRPGGGGGVDQAPAVAAVVALGPEVARGLLEPALDLRGRRATGPPCRWRSPARRRRRRAARPSTCPRSCRAARTGARCRRSA